jgi:UDP-glucose 4-epimerase
MRVLVIGGAGYIGSHCVHQLQLAGHHPVVLDNLSFGHRDAVPDNVPFYCGDIADRAKVKVILKYEHIDIVMHFAAFAYVGESVTDPSKYYKNNVVGTLSLLDAMRARGVNKLVFSSTCATYGNPTQLPIVEDTLQAPINPYGQTKLDVENILKSYAKAYGLSFTAFRYFNAAGASPKGHIGEDHTPETHLIPLVFDAATGRRPAISIYGTDYATPDGTCLRDYVHVDDLASAHIAAFSLLEPQGASHFFNLGTGNPTSVREIIDSVERVTGLTVPMIEEPRREGDPPALYADASKAEKELGWSVEYKTIDSIIASAWEWHKAHPQGFNI